jgi:hypothetical protein
MGKIDEKTKQPFPIALKSDEMFAFAGLWEKWKGETTGRAFEKYIEEGKGGWIGFHRNRSRRGATLIPLRSILLPASPTSHTLSAIR